jgi:hypothetical protein
MFQHSGWRGAIRIARRRTIQSLGGVLAQDLLDRSTKTRGLGLE